MSIDRQLGVKNLTISVEDWNRAKKWVNKRLEEFVVMYGDWKEFQSKSKLNTPLLSAEEVFYNTLKSHGGKMTATDLNNVLSHKMGADNRKKVIANLKIDGKINVIEEGEKTIYVVV